MEKTLKQRDLDKIQSTADAIGLILSDEKKTMHKSLKKIETAEKQLARMQELINKKY